jgi:glycosyltransferase involved in cell wall biosynthesis
MRIAFYAPMKPPDHPLPSGDRTMARALSAALTMAGHEVQQVSRFCSFDATGERTRQQRLAAIGERLAHTMVRRWQARAVPARPDLWFTYHLYHKAPDWLGPHVSAGLGVPYVVAEASHAGKRAHGPWAHGHAAAARAIRRADLIFGLNTADTAGVLPLLSESSRLVGLPPFIDCRPFAAARSRSEHHRRELRTRCAIADDDPIILTVAMMRAGDKLASYRLLSEVFARLAHRRWRLLVAGDGPSRPDVRQAFAALGSRVVWLGQVDPSALPAVYASADLFVWPAIGEAWGMTLLEAQAAGAPVVAGRTGGVPDVVVDGETGLLTPAGDAESLAAAAMLLLDDPPRRQRMRAAALTHVRTRHDLAVASRGIDDALQRLTPGTRSCA